MAPQFLRGLCCGNLVAASVSLAAQQCIATDHQQLGSIDPGCPLAAYCVGRVGPGRRRCRSVSARSVGRREAVNRVKPLPMAILHARMRCTSPGSRAMIRCAALLGSLLGLIACDSGLSSGGPPETCTESGVQCQLPAGPLGVCERSQCGATETPPCFKCTPQH